MEVSVSGHLECHRAFLLPRDLSVQHPSFQRDGYTMPPRPPKILVTLGNLSWAYLCGAGEALWELGQRKE